MNKLHNEAETVKETITNKFKIIRDDISLNKILMEPTKVKLKDATVTPYRVSITRQIPLRYQAQADAYIKKLIDQGIITKVREPTSWCCYTFFVPHPNGKIRLVTDFSPINK